MTASPPPPAEDNAQAERSQHASSALLALGMVLLAVPESWLPGIPHSHGVLWLMAAAITPQVLLLGLDALAGLLLLLACASTLWSVDPGQSAVTAVMWLGWGGLLLACGRRERGLVAAVCVALVLMQVQALRQAVGGLDAAEAEARQTSAQGVLGLASLWAARHRVMGPFTSPDLLAGFAIPLGAVPLSLAVSPGQSLWVRRAGALVSAGTVLMVVGTQSAGGAVAVALALVLVAGPRLWRARSYKALGAAGALAVGLPVAVLVLRSGADPSTMVGVSASQRLEDWANALRVMARVPSWGVGAGAYESAFNAFSGPRRYAAFVHNATLQLGAELGPLGMLLGGGLFVVLLGFAWRRARDGDAASQVLAVGVAAGAIHQQLDYDAHTLAGTGLFVCVALLRADAPSARPLNPGPAVRFWLGAATLAGAWLCAGMALTERGLPRLPGDAPILDQGRRGAALLGFDARAQLALASDLSLAASQEPDAAARGALWVEHDRVALRATTLAPLLPFGPMVLGRSLLRRGELARALPVFHQAVERSCCSVRLHEERLQLARALGDQATAAADEAWLTSQGVKFPPAP